LNQYQYFIPIPNLYPLTHGYNQGNTEIIREN